MPNPPILQMRKDSVGSVITVSMDQTSMSGFSLGYIVWRDPDGDTGTWNGTVDNTARTVSYTLATGDLTVEGTWTLTGKAVKTSPASVSIFGKPQLLYVYA